MTARKRYTDNFRAAAVVMLAAAGYPDKKGALARTASHLEIPASTLRDWFRSEHNPPPTELRDEKRGELLESINAEIAAIFPELQRSRKKAGYQSLGVVLGILIDKSRLLAGQSTEIIELNDWLGELRRNE
jgi:transposase-like protein